MDVMNDLCGSPFWDSNLTWNTRDIPSFTDCFEHTALIWIPSFYACVFFPLECYFLKKSKARDIPFNKYNIAKLIFIISMTMQNISEVFNFRDQNITRPPIYIYSSIMKCLTSMLFFILTVANIKTGIRSSAVLFWYSLILLFCNVLPQIRPSILSLKGKDGFEAELRNGLLSCFLSFVVFTLNCFADSKPKYKLTQQKENYCPSHDASYLSKLLYCWFDVIVKKTHQNPSTTVLWAMEPKESASYLSQKFEKYYLTCNTQVEKHEKTIVKPILKMFWYDITMATFYRLVTTLSSLGFSLIFGLLLTYVENNEPAWKGYFCSFLFLVNGFLLAIASNGTLIRSIQLQYKIRSVLVSTIYRKALRISNSSRKKYTTGEIINLLSMDADNITKSTIAWIQILLVPIQIALIFYFIWDLLGYSALAIIVVLLVGLPFIYFVYKKIKEIQIIRMKKRDSRGKFIQDVLTGIKILKLYAWETYFEKEIFQRRQTELQTTAKYTDLKAFNLFIFACVPLLMSTSTFITYIFSNPNHHEMNIKTAFVTVSLLGSLSFVLRLTQSGLTAWMEAIVSVDRINEFLRSEELDSNAISHDQTVEEAIIMENCTFSWIDEASNSPTLTDINIKIKEGSIVSIVGPVGCGKSSLISAILGEMYQTEGSINVKGKVAYVSQQAWILNTSLKENITLGHPVNESIYEKALDVCALRTDLATMPDGDLTEIGEKGINLSGGQKQRISLARAICYEADIYLFDDPFSAVDFHIANHIFQQAIGPNSILKDKTRLLVTHSTPFLSQTDSIIVLKQGHISEVGNYQTLLENDGEFAKFLQSYANKIENKDDKIINNTKSFEKENTNDGIHRNAKIDSKSTAESPKTLIEEEKLRTVTVKWSVYKYFFSAIGIFFSIGSLTAFVFYQIFSILSNIWLAKWSNASSSNNTNSEQFYFEMYLILGFAEAMIILAGYILFLRGVLKGSSYLHNTLISDVLKWPMWLLHSTPVGRIISRLIEDIFILDDILGIIFVDLLLFIGKFLSICAVVTYITPVSVVIVIPIFLSFYIIMKFYLPLGHQIARLKSMSKSALYSSLVETISGVSSVRSYGYVSRSIIKSHGKIDHYSSTVKSDIMCMRCMNMKMDILAGLFSCFASVFVINARNHLDIGLMAISISYSIQMAKEVVMLLLWLLFVEQFMVAVERIKDYIEHPQEAPSYIPGDSKHTAWPNKGEISFENYSLKYRDDMDLVLHDISFKIKNGERIGIVGRTGAGKTSLILGIFRLVEAATGRIIIDDIDISTIGLHLLRSRLTLIPQDPVLFLGTIRFNLDPTGKCSDENLWKILEKAHLKKFVSDLPGGLQYHIDEGGANISYGQRQLICLARALLRKSKILILDEATASVDVETDELIQKTIRVEFNDCTVLTIAHRLNTVIDYDRILVMDRGHVIEFDTPSNLMKSENSNFHRMAHESGLLPTNIELKQ